MHDKLLKLALYSSTFNILFTPFSSQIAKIFGYLTIVLFVMYPVSFAFKSGKLPITKMGVVSIAVVLAAFINSFSALFNQRTDALVDGIIATLSFLVFYWSLSFPFQGKSSIVLEDIFKVNHILCLIFILFTLLPFDFRYTIVNDYGDTLFTMGLGNPNGTSLYVLFSISILILEFMSAKKVAIKVADIVLISLLTYTLLRLSSRTIIACLILLIVFFIFKLEKIGKYLFYIVLLLPIVMIVVQLNMEYMDVDYQLLGKAIDTGRSTRYQIAIDAIEANPNKYIFGNLCEYWFYNTHNGVLTILCSLGIVGTVFYIVFWFQRFTYLRKISTERYQQVAFLVIMMFMIQSSSESMAVVGTIPYSIHAIIMMKIAKGEIRSKYDSIAENRI